MRIDLNIGGGPERLVREGGKRRRRRRRTTKLVEGGCYPQFYRSC